MGVKLIWLAQIVLKKSLSIHTPSRGNWFRKGHKLQSSKCLFDNLSKALYEKKIKAQSVDRIQWYINFLISVYLYNLPPQLLQLDLHTGAF
jgi:hypothetical protein